MPAGRKVFLTAVIVWAALIFWFSVIQAPLSYGTESTITLHFAAYVMLAFLALHAARKRNWLASTAGVISYGAFLEVLQGFAGRSGDFYDVAANTIGALCAALIIKGIWKKEKT